MKIPEKTITKWQDIINNISLIFNVPVGLIMRLKDEDIEVFVASNISVNPYKVGDSEHFENSGLYCETVIKTKDKLLIPNALKDEHWKNNLDVKLNMISYLGFPINFPDGKPFGTICVLDNKENSYSKSQESLLANLRDLIEQNIAILVTNEIIKEENNLIHGYSKEIKLQKNIIKVCLSCNKVCDEKGCWMPLNEFLNKFIQTLCPDCVK